MVSVERGVSVAEAPVDVVGLYAAHRLGLVRLAYLLADDLTLAEDLVQDAFLGLYRRRGALLDPVAAWDTCGPRSSTEAAARCAGAAPFAPMPTGSDPFPRMPNRPIGG